MSAETSSASIRALCRRAGISRQAYYQGRQRARQRQAAVAQVVEWVRDIRADHPRMGGRKLYHRLQARLEALDVPLGRDHFFALLRAEDLLIAPRKPPGPRTTHGAATRWDNQLQAATIAGPHQAWVADITYLRTDEGFCYLALISDVYSRKILGWNVAASLERAGALRALQQALHAKPPETTPLHHSDRGSQYRSRAYIQRLQNAGCRVSMTEDDHCAENAQAERLNGILKAEYLLDHTFRTIAQARRAAREAIQLYNTDRPHLSLDYQTPAQVHQAA